MANWLDKIREVFTAGVESEADWTMTPDYTPSVRVGAHATNGGTYYRSRYGATGFDGSKYPYGISGSGRGVEMDHWTIRQNARTAYHETLSAHAIVNRYADTVVWTGLKVEPAPVLSVLGISLEEARKWGKNTGERFNMWASSKKSTRDETMTLYQQMRLVEIYQQRDNDYFWRFYYDPRRDLQNPLQVQIIDPEQIKGDTVTSSHGPCEYEDGIKRDAAGREIGYSVEVKKPDGTYEYKEIPAMSRGRRIMGHGFFSEYAGQQRGYSLLHSMLQELQNLTDFTVSELKKAIGQSSIMGLVKPSNDKPASAVFDSMMNQIATNGVTTSSGSALTPAEESAALGISPLYEATISQPGQIVIDTLEGGEDFTPFKNTAPTSGFAEFFGEVITNLGAARSMPAEVVRMKFGTNYSASRAALMMFWQVIQIWREELVADFLAYVYEAWLTGEIAAGRIQAPGWSDPRLKAAWLNAGWHSLPMPSIDPLKESNAVKNNLEMGLTNQPREARALNGSDASQNMAINAEMFPQTPHAPWGITEAQHAHNMEGEGEEEGENEEDNV